jgi:predicted ATPase
MEKTKLFVITGGPGVGKTTLVNALKNQGLPCGYGRSQEDYSETGTNERRRFAVEE